MEDKFHPAHEDDIQQLLEGPRDERDLDKLLAGGFKPLPCFLETNLSHQTEGESCSLTRKDAMTVQTLRDIKLNLLDFIPKDGFCRRGPRGPRKRVAFMSKPLCFENMPFASRGKRHGVRKNNDHWTLEEVTNLVKGVSKHGVGRWAEIKSDYFSSSIRTAVNIKDKWRNLLKACGIKFRSKKKVKAQKTMLRPLDVTLIEQIKWLAYKHPYPRGKRS